MKKAKTSKSKIRKANKVRKPGRGPRVKKAKDVEQLNVPAPPIMDEPDDDSTLEDLD